MHQSIPAAPEHLVPPPPPPPTPSPLPGHVETQTMQTADCADRADCADWVFYLYINFLVKFLL